MRTRWPHRSYDTGWLLRHTAAMLASSGRPWVVENVSRAHIPRSYMVVLCGSMFGLEVRRHRRFWSSHAFLLPPCNHEPRPLGVYGHPGGSSVRDGDRRGSTAEWRDAMECQWMTAAELAQAIPPAYTELIGAQLIGAVRDRSSAISVDQAEA